MMTTQSERSEHRSALGARPIVVGLAGKARHGKNTAAEVIAEVCHPTPMFSLGFADGVREEAKASGAWDGVVPYTPEGRSALQRVGTIRRSEDVDYWVKRAFRRIGEMAAEVDGPSVFVLTDVRFPNEARTIIRSGGFLYRIVRVNGDGTPFDNGMTPEQKAHPSETSLDDWQDWDGTLVNDGTDTFKMSVCETFRGFLARRRA